MICKKYKPNICVHTFECECTSYLIQNNICKPVLLLIKFFSILSEKHTAFNESIWHEIIILRLTL